MVLDDFALAILEERYLWKDKDGKIKETPDDMFRRVAKVAADNEKDSKKWFNIFYSMIKNLDFMPNSPTLFNAGKKDGQLSACFVLPIEDSMESIFKTLKDMAMIQKTGGGCGMSFSRLRPKGSIVSSTHGVSSGPVTFMECFDAVSNTIKQGGLRRSANMGILRVDHPDIEVFIDCKAVEGSLDNFNISVALTDAFMDAVSKSMDFELIDPHTKKVVNVINAKKLFDKICKAAWEIGEPGFFFIDTANKGHSLDDDIESTNPCGEEPLLPYESCNLGSINLSNMVKARMIDYDKLVETVEYAIRYLDNIIDVNCFPIEEIKVETLKNRKIGLGIMGFADLLTQMGYAYDSDEAFEVAEEIMERIAEVAHEASRDLGQEKGPFPDWLKSKFKDDKNPPRNAECITMAPTGTIATICGVNWGIEPYYALIYNRNVLDRTFVVKNKHLNPEEYGKTWEEIEEDKGTLSVPVNIFKTAHEISPKVHVEMQSVFQKYVDAAVSKTINMRNDATVDEVTEAVWLAYRLGCKGLTVYRDGSRRRQVLEVGKPVARPEVLPAKVFKLKTGCGSIYPTISIRDGKPFEVFLVIGKSGGCTAAHTQALGRIVSVALRSGVELSSIIKQLRNIRCHMPYMGKRSVLSCPDALGIALQNFEEEEGMVESVGGVCPECEGVLIFQDGCIKCSSCSWSRCG